MGDFAAIILPVCIGDKTCGSKEESVEAHAARKKRLDQQN
jgi:hypothetical protein